MAYFLVTRTDITIGEKTFENVVLRSEKISEGKGGVDYGELHIPFRIGGRFFFIDLDEVNGPDGFESKVKIDHEGNFEEISSEVFPRGKDLAIDPEEDMGGPGHKAVMFVTLGNGLFPHIEYWTDADPEEFEFDGKVEELMMEPFVAPNLESTPIGPALPEPFLLNDEDDVGGVL